MVRSAPTAQLHKVVLLVRPLVAWAQLRRALALRQQATGLAASRGEAAELAVLHDRVADPVDARVVTDDLVEWIHHDHLEPLVRSVLPHPVRVQHAEASALPADALLGDAAEIPHGLPLVDALAARLAVDNALRHALLAVATAHADPVHEEPLLRLVAQLTRLVRPSRARATVERRQLAVLPIAHAPEEAHHVRLLLPPHLLEVLVSAHLAHLLNLTAPLFPHRGLDPKS
mmetsp:Transcript_83651/g.179323  ORF Transcript_83651/g.179323 Transcript_83651/m.179323 type:complete len:230 (+) Transcript_83651:113-802(+)